MKWWLPRRVWASALVMLLSIGGVLAVAGAPAAAAPCGGSCVGSFAAAVGCTSDEQDVADVTVPTDNWVYKIFYSPACHTAWGEASTDDGEPAQGIGILQIWVIPPTGGVEAHIDSGLSADDPSPVVDTPMASWDDSVKVCTNYTHYAGVPRETLDDDPNTGEKSGWGDPSKANYTGGCTSWR